MPDESPDVQKERALLQHHHDMIKARVGPHLNEHFEGFVVMGYVTTDAGIRRLVIYNDNKNPILADALRVPLSVAAKWGMGQL